MASHPGRVATLHFTSFTNKQQNMTYMYWNTHTHTTHTHTSHTTHTLTHHTHTHTPHTHTHYKGMNVSYKTLIFKQLVKMAKSRKNRVSDTLNILFVTP